jgi:hypothetical protein
MATPVEIAAYIGAAAWLPQIILFIYSIIVRPKITVVPEKQVEIGYTSLGPIFNIRLAVSSERKNAIIDHVGVTLKHEDGSVHIFSWAGMKETFSQITDITGKMQQAVEREYNPIALVLIKSNLVERLFRFQDSIYHSKIYTLGQKVADHTIYLKTTKPNFHDELIESKEIHDLIKFEEEYFFWKPGKYCVNFSVKSPNTFNFSKSSFTFELKSYDVENLRKNLLLFKKEATNFIKTNIDGYDPEDLIWNWATVKLNRIEN